ncbi:MAG: hypothetical protein IJH04_07920 [Eggerthellaceae bacterium]|nr:hypothetical protein [Eggerthellaceae bacterium]
MSLGLAKLQPNVGPPTGKGAESMEEERETTVGAFEINGEQAGVFIDPPSDVEMTYIQCPPSFAETKVNPRPAVVLFSDGAIEEADGRIDALKAVASEHKQFILCPAAFDEDSLFDCVDWLLDNEKPLNIRGDDIRFGSVPGSESTAEGFRAIASEEYGAEFADVETFEV